MYNLKHRLVTSRTLSYLLTFFLLIPTAFSQTQTVPTTYEQLLSAIREVQAANQPATKQGTVNSAWEIGNLIEQHAAQYSLWGNYSGELNPKLAKDLHFTVGEINIRRRFARMYSKIPEHDLSWGHYYYAMAIEEPAAREAMLERAEKEKWGIDRFKLELQKLPAPKLRTPSPEPLKIYRVIMRNQKLYLDLGFDTFLELPEKDQKRWKAGDIVESINGELSAFSSQPSAKSNSELAESGKPTAESFHTYAATVTEIVDGDTFDASVDLGYGIFSNQKFRLAGIDSPEIDTPEGAAAKKYLYDQIKKVNGKVLIRSDQREKFLRWLADLWIDGRFVNEDMLTKGLAKTMSLNRSEWGEYLLGKESKLNE